MTFATLSCRKFNQDIGRIRKVARRGRLTLRAGALAETGLHVMVGDREIAGSLRVHPVPWQLAKCTAKPPRCSALQNGGAAQKFVVLPDSRSCHD